MSGLEHGQKSGVTGVQLLSDLLVKLKQAQVPFPQSWNKTKATSDKLASKKLPPVKHNYFCQIPAQLSRLMGTTLNRLDNRESRSSNQKYEY